MSRRTALATPPQGALERDADGWLRDQDPKPHLRPLTRLAPARLNPARFGDSWAGVWAAVQGLALTLLLLAGLAMAAMLATTAHDGTGTPWGAAAGVAGAIWLLGHGTDLMIDGSAITLVPLGVTALALFGVYSAGRRCSVVGRGGVLGGVATYTGCALLIGSALQVHGWAMLGAAIGACAVSGFGLLLASGAATRMRTKVIPRRAAWPGATTSGHDVRPALGLGLRTGLAALLGLLACGALLVAVWAVLGREVAAQTVDNLSPGPVGTGVLAVAQLSLLPNLVVWATSWLSGGGFALGAGTEFAPSGITQGPLPALPMLAALPPESWTGAVVIWVPLVVVACGALGGALAWRRLDPKALAWPDVVVLALAAGLSSGAGMWGLQWLAGGALGEGRLAMVGAAPTSVAAVCSALIAAGVAMVFTGAHAGTKTG